jgi:hypothetical protein
VASSKPVSERSGRWIHRSAYAAGVGVFVWLCAQFYLPGQGFTWLIMFGGNVSRQYLPELQATSFYAQENSYGYDAQYYAQIAMHPQLRDPVLRNAVDSLPYRARRILFCWTAYGLAGGNAVRALHIYAVQNIIAWLLLAWVLVRWFPATNWENVLRWFGVMFTFGLCFSVRGSLVDGPSLLLIAIGMALLESGRPWWSAVVLGVAGLGKETNILAGAAVAVPSEPGPKRWAAALLRLVLVIAPLLAWLACLKMWLGNGGDVGARNFDWPFLGYLRKWREALHPLFAAGSGEIARAELLVLVAMTVQWLFFIVRPRWRDPWWRLGASYSVLMVVLGDAVWEGYPGAASRVLLPMTLAFNVSLPRGGRWLTILILGNLLVWPSVDTLVPPGREDAQVQGPRDLKYDDERHDQVQIRFPESEWYGLERNYLSYWRWAHGPATLTLHNPHAHAVVADISFRLKSSDERTVTVREDDHVLWTGSTGETMRDVDMRHVVLPPGDTTWRFETDHPAAIPPNNDPRPVAFRLCDFRVVLRSRAIETGAKAP